MGNGPIRAWPPAAVVTIVHAGGRTEEYKRAMLVGELMHLHPRHNVVRPDFFRSSRAVVLEPQHVLMPGQRFFLVPFHTVHKRLLRIRQEAQAAAAAAAAAPRMHQRQQASVASTICSSSCSLRCGSRKYNVVAGSPLARRPPSRRAPQARRAPAVMRSPSSRASSLSKSPATVSLLLARKQLIHKERGLSRGGSSRRRPSVDHEEYAERRTSLQSQMREHDEWPFEAPVMPGAAPAPPSSGPVSKWPDPMERRGLLSKQPASPVTSPPSESFHTPMSSPPPFGSPVVDTNSIQAMDSSDSIESLSALEGKRNSEHTPPPDSGRCTCRGCNCGRVAMGSSSESILQCASIQLRMMKESSSRRVVGHWEQRSMVLIPPAGADGGAQIAVVHDHVMEAVEDSPMQCAGKGDLGGVHPRTRELHRSGFNETSRPYDPLDWKGIHDLLAVKIAAVHSRHALRSGGTRQNGMGQAPPAEHKQVVLRQVLELDRSSSTRYGGAQQQQCQQHQGGRAKVAESGSECVCLPEFKLCSKGAENSKTVTPSNGKVKLAVNPPLSEQKPSMVLVSEPAERTATQSETPSGKQQKNLRYRHRLIQHLCFSSQGLSPVHPTPPVRSGQQPREMGELKLIDHLKRDNASPVKQYQKDGSHQRVVPWPPSGNQIPDGVDNTADDMDLLGSRNESDSSEAMDVSRTFQKQMESAEYKFLKMPPMGFRRRRIRTRNRVHQLANWKPNLSPLVEFN